MSSPTRKELIDRLREIEGVRSYDELAFRIGMTPRKLARWRTTENAAYDKTIELLDHAGALNWSDDVAELDAEIEELLAELEAVLGRVVPGLRRALGRPGLPRADEGQ